MKVCSTCGVEKPVDEFYKGNRTAKCKPCYREAQKPRDRGRDRSEYYKANKERMLGMNSEWKKANSHKNASYQAKRRASLRDATPDWLTSHQLSEIHEFYAEAKRLTEVTGIKHHVDHIEPLRGDNFTGLHVPWNLQVIPHYKNESKGNKLIN